MANGLGSTPSVEPTNELDYIRAVLHEMALRPIWLRKIDLGSDHPNAASLILVPEWVEEVIGLRAVARTLAQDKFDYVPAIFPGLRLRLIWLDGIIPGDQTHPEADALVSLPQWVEGHNLVMVRRGIARTLGQEATNLEERRRQAQLAQDGNGSIGFQAMIGGNRR